MTSSREKKVDGCAWAKEARRRQVAVLAPEAGRTIYQLTCDQLDLGYRKRWGESKPCLPN